MTDEDVWLLSYYRSSELQGAMLFGRLCRELRDPAIQRDMTGHFADEARHAFLWTRCLDRMGAAPVPVERVYQDGYLEACGVPASMVEILALTQVFELRVLSHYEAHRALPDVLPEIRSVLDVLLADERGHVAWVRNALDAQAGRHGQAAIDRAVARCAAADREVFARALAEHGDRIGALAAAGVR